MKLLFAMLALAVAHAATSDPAIIQGRVADPSGAVVPGAIVTLTNRSSAGSVQAAAGRDGRFRFANVVPGSYDVMAESAGFAPFRRGGLAVAAGQSMSVEIGLEIPQMCEQVVVRAKAPAGENALETSSQNTREILEIREVRESAAKDLAEAIASLEGLWKIRRAGIANDVVLRGFQQGNVDVLIDGSRIYGACPGHMDPAASHVDFAEIETVEVTKGPFDIRNQGSLGGTVNIVSKRPGYGFEMKPNFGAASFGFVNPSFTASISKSRIYALAGYSYRRSDPYQDGLGRLVTSYANYTAAGARNRAFDVNTGWGRLGVELSKRQSLEVAYTRQSAGRTLYPALTMDAQFDNADRLSANWTLSDLAGFVKQVRAEGYFSQVKHWMTDELRATGVGTPLGFAMGTYAGTRALGGRIEADLPGTIVGIEGYDRGWSVVGNMVMMGRYSAQASLPDVRMLVGGAYGQYRRMFGRWNVTLGGRLDAANSAALSPSLDTNLYWIYRGTRSTSASDVAPSGNVRLTYPLPMGVEFFAGAGSSVRLPDPQERYYAVRRGGSDWIGNPTLEPTRNNETDIGINLRSRRFTLRPTFFYSRLANFVALTNQPRLNPMPGYMNASARSYEAVDARLYGGEVSYSAGFTRSLLLSGGVSYTRGIEFAQPAAGRPKADMAELPPLKARASLRYGSRLFFAEVNGLASTAQERVNRLVQEQPTPGYALLGLKAGIHRGQFNVTGGIDNALDHFYYEHLSFQRDPFRSGVRIPEPGRSFYVNVSMDFGDR